MATLHSKYKEDFKCVLKSDKLVKGLVKNIVNFFEAADDVWTVSESAIDTLREYGYKGDVFVVSNGSDIPVTKRNDDTRNRIIQCYGLTPQAPILTYVGQHTRQKNVHLIIQALNIIRRHGLRFNMLFIGDGPYRKELSNLCSQSGLDDHVRFTGRIGNRQHLREIYAASLAVLFPSLYDTSSLVIKEAASCSCPVVLVEGGTTSQGVIDCENGFIAKNNAEAYAFKLEQMINTEGLAYKAGDGALRTLYKPWKDVVDDVYGRYLYLIDKKRSGEYTHSGKR